MPRIALQLTDDLIHLAHSFTGTEDNGTFDGYPYAIVTFLSPTEFNFKLATEDEIVEAAMIDSDLAVISL